MNHEFAVLILLLLSALGLIPAMVLGGLCLVMFTRGIAALRAGRNPEDRLNCPFCGYEMGLPESSRCPECGQLATPEHWKRWRQENQRKFGLAQSRLGRAIIVGIFAVILLAMSLTGFAIGWP